MIAIGCVAEVAHRDAPSPPAAVPARARRGRRRPARCSVSYSSRAVLDRPRAALGDRRRRMPALGAAGRVEQERAGRRRRAAVHASGRTTSRTAQPSQRRAGASTTSSSVQTASPSVKRSRRARRAARRLASVAQSSSFVPWADARDQLRGTCDQGRSLSTRGSPGKAEDPLAEDVAHDLRRAALDRVGPGAQEHLAGRARARRRGRSFVGRRNV